MLVFIDDSGDPSFSLDKGSTKVFVIACIVFKDDLEAEKTAVAIKELRRKLKFSDQMEFKFSGSSNATRKTFFETVRPFQFVIRTLVVEKKKIKSEQLRNNKQSFYSYFIKTVLQYSRKTILNAKIRIDGSGDRIFRKQFLSYLRRELNSKDTHILKQVRLVNSKSDVLIQLADMAAGTIRRFKEGDKKDRGEYWDLIKRKIEDCWDFS